MMFLEGEVTLWLSVKSSAGKRDNPVSSCNSFKPLDTVPYLLVALLQPKLKPISLNCTELWNSPIQPPVTVEYLLQLQLLSVFIFRRSGSDFSFDISHVINPVTCYFNESFSFKCWQLVPILSLLPLFLVERKRQNKHIFSLFNFSSGLHCLVCGVDGSHWPVLWTSREPQLFWTKSDSS